MPLFPVQLLSTSVQVFSVPSPLKSSALSEFTNAGFSLPSGLAQAVAARKDEFAAGRYCAWRALGKLAIPGTGASRAPKWPAGFVGSIAHTRGVAVAAVASQSERASLGIDLEPCMSLAQASTLRSRLLTPMEERMAKGLTGWSEGDKVTLVFSAKEAIYKCLHPLCGEFFGFHDAQLTQVDDQRDGRAGKFTFELLRELPGGFASGWRGEGRFVRDDGWVFTAIEVPAHS